MKRSLQLSVLVVALLANVCRGEEVALCKADCDADRRECRGKAEALSRDDTSPLLAMGERNPHALAQRGADGLPDLRPEGLNDYRNRRGERIGQCEDRYLRCTRNCAGSAGASSTSNVLVDRKRKEREYSPSGSAINDTRLRDFETDKK